MKILKIIGYSLMGLFFGGMMAMLQLAMFNVLFLSPEPYPIPMYGRVITYIFILIINLGWGIESILREVREHNLINEFKKM